MYKTIQVGVKVIIKNSEDLYLLIQRSGPKTMWDIPGGRINPEEDLQTALAREVKEEINATLTGTPKLLAAQDIFVPAKNFHVVRLTYRLSMDVHDVALSDEHDAHCWVSREDALKLDLDPYLQEVLAKL